MIVSSFSVHDAWKDGCFNELDHDRDGHAPSSEVLLANERPVLPETDQSEAAKICEYKEPWTFGSCHNIIVHELRTDFIWYRQEFFWTKTIYDNLNWQQIIPVLRPFNNWNNRIYNSSKWKVKEKIYSWQTLGEKEQQFCFI